MRPDYIYKAVIVKIIDGDTIDVDIDLGFNIWMKNQRLRLTGIDTPELSGIERTAGLQVKAYVQNILPIGSGVVLQTKKDSKEKYGRWLATVWYFDGSTWINLNQSLLDQNMALPE